MRTVFAVIVAFIAMSIFAFGLSILPWYVYGLDGVLEPKRFDTTAMITAYSLVISFVGAVLGGFIVRRIGRSMIGVVVLAILCLIGGAANAIGQMYKPEPSVRQSGVTIMEAVQQRKEPAWYTLLIPLIGVGGVMIGGRGNDGKDEKDAE
jgi:MFS family permease